MSSEERTGHEFDKGKYLGLASQAEKNGENKDALEYYDKILHHDNGDIDTWLLKGKLCQKIEQFETAQNCFDQILNLDPEHFEAVLFKAVALEGLDDREESLLQYGRAIRLVATDPRPYLFKGKLLAIMGREKEAIESLEQSLRLDPDQSDAWLTKASCHQTLERYIEALEAYDSSIEKDDTSYDAVLARGMLKAQLSKHEEALEDFRGAKSLRKNRVKPYYHEALTLDLLGKVDECRDVLLDGLGLADPIDADNALLAKMNFQMALLYESRDLPLQAYQHLIGSRDLDPDEALYDNYINLVSSEYRCDLRESFIISQLDGLLSEDPGLVRAALRSLVQLGQLHTLSAVIATLYDPHLLAKVLIKTLPGEITEQFGPAVEKVLKDLSNEDLDPAGIKDLALGELENLESIPASGSSEVMQKTGEILGEFKKKLEGDSELILEDFEEFAQLMEMDPRPELISLSIYLVMIAGGNYAILLDHDEQPHLLDIRKDPNHVRQTVFSRFTGYSSEFEKSVNEAFDKPKDELVAEARKYYEQRLIISISKNQQNDTWLTLNGGGA